MLDTVELQRPELGAPIINTPAVPKSLSNEFVTIDYVSDLHMDFSGAAIPESFFKEDAARVLVIAGDAMEVERYKDHMEFWDRVSDHWETVLMISGNHEHYRSVFQETVATMREVLKGYPNIHVLDNETFELDGVLFLGATLWTDFNNADHVAMYTARRGMNDYRMIKDVGEMRGILVPETTLEAHRRSLFWLGVQLDLNPTKPCVVITHHAPHIKSEEEQYSRMGDLNYAYYTDLEGFILDHPNVLHWIHGHMHTRKSYTVGDTQVHCNARGYPGQFAKDTEYCARQIFV